MIQPFILTPPSWFGYFTQLQLWSVFLVGTWLYGSGTTRVELSAEADVGSWSGSLFGLCPVMGPDPVIRGPQELVYLQRTTRVGLSAEADVGSWSGSPFGLCPVMEPDPVIRGPQELVYL
ncbi:hypothetical protein TIFTF001_033426 [Ficus carica]|uniref:Uncharacterized protein n=1 Tax=Ficus carica TaxID=3494 RepID=A0AA88DYT0_FICCA|nr:hypothetical protein TIFTF001_033426 [Ficus carica]